VVDVANVMGSRPDGWWRDRAGAAVRLYSELAALAASGRAIVPGSTSPEGGAEEDAAQEHAALGDAVAEDAAQEHAAAPPDFVMVLEGAARAAAARIRAAEAARGPQGPAAGPDQPGQVRVVEARGSGDDAIVALVRELPGRRAVVTADRELRERCTAVGAAVLGPAWLIGLMRQ
jgi:8-oxo-dGTP diphosphatase